MPLIPILTSAQRGVDVTLSKTRDDQMLLLGAITLIGIGLVMVYSSSSILAIHQHGDGLYFLKRQLMWLSLGIVAFCVGNSFDYHLLGKMAKFLFGVGIILLCLTLLFGKEVNGAKRWLMVGPLSFQTSEYMKVALVIYLARVLAQKKKKIEKFSCGFLPPLLVLAVTSLLIMMQPHLGMVLIMIFVGGVMIFMAGARIIHSFYFFGGGIALLYLLIFKLGYGKQRVLILFDPWSDPLGKGYQIIQSIIALGRGGLAGTGLGSSQQKFFYLPYPHTDFVFAIIGEEAGFLGAALVVILFLWLAFWGIKISYNSKDSFGTLLGIGLVSMITIQAIINMGVVTGIFPITGLPLPLISVGGSSLLFTMWSLGIILNISKASKGTQRGRRLACGY